MHKTVPGDGQLHSGSCSSSSRYLAEVWSQCVKEWRDAKCRNETKKGTCTCRQVLAFFCTTNMLRDVKCVGDW